MKDWVREELTRTKPAGLTVADWMRPDTDQTQGPEVLAVAVIFTILVPKFVASIPNKNTDGEALLPEVDSLICVYALRNSTAAQQEVVNFCLVARTAVRSIVWALKSSV